ncbi:hypothetical protein BDV25DRAFT_150744 [Aspergillus avenaceus]|uniref:Uncharacterized protein n=1 Tax=Aspergillus avenaceus TaxID=36643 RepID=A0A5N6U220_ASPAV|nr:hypothetical protein BDV25DRAFT_150744 [Aspergillus avenaceus]
MIIEMPRQSLKRRSSDPSTDQVIIGVVVSGVAVIAITAGILCFLFKRRRWDRIRRREEEMLTMHGSMGYKPEEFTADDHTMMPPRPSSSMHSYNQAQDQPTQTHGRLSDDTPPPAYTTIPAYDPSRYHAISQLPPTVKVTRPVYANPFGGFEERPFSFIRGVEQQYTGPTAPQRDSSQIQERGPSPESSRSIESDRSTNFSRPLDTAQSPRRPKPVLTRLVTNFG